MNDTSDTTHTSGSDLTAVYQALNRTQLVIEFEMDGTVITANPNFVETFGYGLDEIRGQHHRMLCEPGYAESPEYQQFWTRLGRGEVNSGEFKRFGKNHKAIWIQAAYSPIFNASGEPFKVVKFATDITESKQRNAEYESKVAAISKSQAVIEFNLDGTVITANDNFLTTFGYSIEEVRGQHHQMFCEPSYARSTEYTEFWARLARGEFISEEFKRLSKEGDDIWLQATYNPILDMNGQPFKVVKFASDITDEVHRRSVALLEMATPVTKIWDGVLFVPLVGFIDSARAQSLMTRTLSGIADAQARVLMLDISGVAVMDTAVANHLIKVAKAAVLMGCQTIISGISPAIAETIVALGIDVGSINTKATIEAALKDAITKSAAE